MCIGVPKVVYWWSFLVVYKYRSLVGVGTILINNCNKI